MTKFEEINTEIFSIICDGDKKDRDQSIKDLLTSKLTPYERPLFKKWLESREGTEPILGIMIKDEVKFGIDRSNIEHWEFVLNRLKSGYKIKEIADAYAGVDRMDIDLEITMVWKEY